MTSFEETVWRKCKIIPKGKVSTYKALAKAVGKPNAARAVGNALNKNRDLKNVPCYRVVKSSGAVGGYSRGRKIKIKLLKKDGIEVKNGRIINFEKYMFNW